MEREKGVSCATGVSRLPRQHDMNHFPIEVPIEGVREFCARWRVRECSLFGSVLRDDFRPDSDVDVLVSFHDDASHDLWDRVSMIVELEQLFGRKVDLVDKEGLRNPYRRQNILKDNEVIYAAG